MSNFICLLSIISSTTALSTITHPPFVRLLIIILPNRTFFPKYYFLFGRHICTFISYRSWYNLELSLEISPIGIDKYTVVLQLLGTSCWYRDNCITKLWYLSSYFIYLYVVFFQHCFHLEQHCFHLDRQFSCSPNISNWLSQVPTQSSIVIQNSCSSD